MGEGGRTPPSIAPRRRSRKAGYDAAHAPRRRRVASDSAHGAVVVELAPSLAEALARAFAPPPPAGYRTVRAAAAIHGELDVDLRTLSILRGASRRPLAPPSSARGPTLLGAPSVIGWRIAASDLRLDPPDGHVALNLALRDESFARVPLDPRLTYRLAGGSFTAAVGDGVIERMLGGTSGPAEPGTHDLPGRHLAGTIARGGADFRRRRRAGRNPSPGLLQSPGTAPGTLRPWLDAAVPGR